MKALSKTLWCLFLGLWLMAWSADYLCAQEEITGDWNGLLKVQGMQLRLVFHVEQSGVGYTATMDSPDQGAEGIPVTSISFQDSQLELEVSPLGINYQGIMDTNNFIKGTFKQAGQSFPLDLSKEFLEKEVLQRPQEPTEPFPYDSDEVSINSVDGVTLAGTLTQPKSGASSVVVLISGSGPQDRDETFMSHKPFLVLADHLTRQGIAVLRYDDRGTAESTGNFNSATSEDFANDVKYVINYLINEHKFSNIGLIGHSEGGLIAPMVASESTEVKFIVLLAGPGMAGDQILIKQNELMSRDMGQNSDETAYGLEVAKTAFEIIKGSTDPEKLSNELESYLIEAYKSPLAVVPEGMKSEDLIKLQVNRLASPWMRYFLTYDPKPTLSKVECAVLAINGEKDVQVTVDNLAHIEQALVAGGNQSTTIKSYPGMNHLFQPCETGSINEYAQIEQTISPLVLEDISDWIRRQVKQ